jgi:hypothetical protein
VLKPEDPVLEETVALQKFIAARALFERRELYFARGWEIEEPEFPLLRVWFVGPDHRRRVGVRIYLRNYDLTAPSLTFISPTSALLRDEDLGLLLRPPDQTKIPPARYEGQLLFAQSPKGTFAGYLPGGHPLTQRPFLCIRGTWEFHSHPQHADVPWEWIRTDPNYGLDYLLTHARACFREDVFA